VRLHYNPRCPHHGRPTTPLRLQCNSGRYTEAQDEITRLRTLALEPAQNFVVDAHEVLIQLRQGKIGYGQARMRLAGMAPTAREVFSTEGVADFRLMRIGVAARKGDRVEAKGLIRQFFEDIPRTPTTEAAWYMAQGYVEIQPDEAIPYFAQAVTLLDDAPCLQEMAARFMARHLCALGKAEEAAAALQVIGLPASINPRPGQVYLHHFLVLPMA